MTHHRLDRQQRHRLNNSWIAGIFVSLMAFGQAQPALGCSCLPPHSPCAAMQSDAVIFVGTPVTTEPTSFTERGTVAIGPRAGEAVTQTIPGVRLRFAVDEWIHADIDGKTVEVSTMADTAACGYPFKVGVRYLVYASHGSTGLVVSFCSRTGPVTAREDDLALLHETKNGVVKSRLSGVVYKMELRVDGSFYHLEPVAGLPNVTVVAEGTSPKQEIPTDEQGRFVFVGLEPGRYAVTPNLPGGMEILFGPGGPVTLDHCSAEIGFPVASTPLAGTVENDDGSLAGKYVRVDVVKTDVDTSPPSRERGTYTFTEADGTWKLKGLPAGRYRIGLNLFGAPTPDSPYPPTWHPTSPQRAEPLVLDVSDSRTQRIRIVAPARIVARSIEGIVLDAAGAPVADASVLLFDAEQPTSHVSNASSGRDGRFSIKALQGRHYRIQASALSHASRQFLQSAVQEVPDDGKVGPLTLLAVAPGDKP